MRLDAEIHAALVDWLRARRLAARGHIDTNGQTALDAALAGLDQHEPGTDTRLIAVLRMLPASKD